MQVSGCNGRFTPLGNSHEHLLDKRQSGLKKPMVEKKTAPATNQNAQIIEFYFL
jgi:hypothetical protein